MLSGVKEVTNLIAWGGVRTDAVMGSAGRRYDIVGHQEGDQFDCLGGCNDGCSSLAGGRCDVVRHQGGG